MPLRILVILALSFLAFPSFAMAQDAPGAHPVMAHPATAEIPAPITVERYGWQIGLLDTAAILMVFSAAGNDNESLGVLGIGTYLLGGPAVHAARGHGGRAIGSLALRVGLPWLGAQIAVSGGNCDPEVEDCCGEDDYPRILLGGMAGVLAAGAIDWFILSKEEHQAGALSLQPTFAPTPGGGGQVGLMGVF